jgi:hypothetical protein
MSLDQAIENAQHQRRAVDEHGEIFWRRGDNFVVYDRNKGEFVKCDCITIPSLSKKPRKGLRGWLKDAAENVVKRYRHWKDVTGIARKHGLWTAVQYEGRAIMAELRLAKLYFEMALQSDYEMTQLPHHQPNPIVQVDKPKIPGIDEETFLDLGAIDYGSRDKPFGDNIICNNSLGLGRGPNEYDISKLLERLPKPPENGDI